MRQPLGGGLGGWRPGDLFGVTDMERFDDPGFYGDRWAGVYDEHFAEMDPALAVEFLAGLAGGRRVLELAIGTGRVALPLPPANPPARSKRR